MADGSYTRTIALEQAGSSLGGIWTEAPLASPTPVTVQVGGLIGLVYNVQLAGGSPFDMVTSFTPNRALDPPIWVNTGTLTLVNQSATGGFVDIHLVPDPSPDLFSTANPPTLTGVQTLLDNALLGTAAAPPDTLAITLSGTANTTIRAFAAGSVYWTGRIALVLDWQVGLASTLTVSSLVNTTFQTFWSGLTGGPTGPRQRYVRDHRYAMPALNTELVRDGDQAGLWVRPWDADPEDEPNTYRPRPGEGTVDDSIGDL